MKCPLCGNYFQQENTTFYRIYPKGKEPIRVCKDCCDEFKREEEKNGTKERKF